MCRPWSVNVPQTLAACAQAAANLCGSAEGARVVHAKCFPHMFTTLAHLDAPTAHEATLLSLYYILRHDASVAEEVRRTGGHC